MQVAATLHLDAGNVVAAEPLIHVGLAMASQMRNDPLRLRLLCVKAAVLLRRQEWAAALALGEEAITLSRRLGDRLSPLSPRRVPPDPASRHSVSVP